MSILSDLAMGGVSDILNGVNSLGQTFFGSKVGREQADADYNSNVQDTYASEYTFRQDRTWWDSFCDGINRLVRPGMAFGVIGLFVYCMVDPTGFSVRMTALNLVNEYLWALLGSIVVFYFGTKSLEVKWKNTATPEAVKQVINAQKAVAKLENEMPDNTSVSARVDSDTVQGIKVQVNKPVIKESEYQAQMSSDKPLSNAAIAEWNRRRKQATATNGGK